MRVAVGADHAGFEMKRDLAGVMAQQGHEIIDLGTHSSAPVDYPDIAEAVATAIRNGQAERGVIVCGSGAGVAVAACKFPGVRAAVCHDCYTAQQAVEHDDVNVMCLGAQIVGQTLAIELIKSFLDARFSTEEHFRRRVQKLHEMERRFADEMQGTR